MHSRTRTTLDWLAELDLGAWILGMGSFVFGFACLLQRDFAIYWQPVPAGVPFRHALAFASAVLHMVSGLALLHRSTARLASQPDFRGRLFHYASLGAWVGRAPGGGRRCRDDLGTN
jgi:uncharacterized membrane protein